MYQVSQKNVRRKILPPFTSNVVTSSTVNTQLRHRVANAMKTTFLVHWSAFRVYNLTIQP